MVTIDKALGHLMHGKPVRLAYWQDNEYLRYAELFEVYEMVSGGEKHYMEELTLPGESFCDPEWVLGDFDPVREGVIHWRTDGEEK
jgi:hypothetical protein